LNGFVEDVQLEIDPDRLLSEAEKWKDYRVLIPDDRVVFRIKNTDFRFTSIPAEGVHRVMLMIDGERNVYEIMNETGLTRAAIYKALKKLFLQGVIEREQRHTDTDTGKFLNKSITMRFFLKLVGEIMADLTMELGEKKSESILDNSTKATNHDEFFLQTIKVGESTETNIQRMNAWMVEQQRHISARDLVNGFKNIITFLLREEYHLLGFKSLKNTIQRVLEISDTIPQEEQQIADSMIGFLKRVLNDEKELVDTEGSFNSLSTDDESKKDHDIIPFPHLSQIGGAMVIAFYSRILQFIMDDLDAAIGSKSDGLILKIMANSPYHEKFLSQFNVRDDVKTNVERIRQSISDRGLRLSKISFINGFQQALLDLLYEEKQLLGTKAAGASVMKVEKLIPILKQQEFKWLAEHLIQTIKSRSDFMDGWFKGQNV
jgi:predicted transcriptional regulator